MGYNFLYLVTLTIVQDDFDENSEKYINEIIKSPFKNTNCHLKIEETFFS